MVKGLRTVIHPVGDMGKGKAWYSAVLGCDPYFDQPFYVGCAAGALEPGLVPDGEPGAQGCLAYWGVDNIAGEIARIVSLGGTARKAAQDVGEGIRVAELLDPYGNALGLIDNPHFDAAAVR